MHRGVTYVRVYVKSSLTRGTFPKRVFLHTYVRRRAPRGWRPAQKPGFGHKALQNHSKTCSSMLLVLRWVPTAHGLHRRSVLRARFVARIRMHYLRTYLQGFSEWPHRGRGVQGGRQAFGLSTQLRTYVRTYVHALRSLVAIPTCQRAPLLRTYPPAT
jgi:hypothetical protein